MCFMKTKKDNKDEVELSIINNDSYTNSHINSIDDISTVVDRIFQDKLESVKSMNLVSSDYVKTINDSMRIADSILKSSQSANSYNVFYNIDEQICANIYYAKSLPLFYYESKKYLAAIIYFLANYNSLFLRYKKTYSLSKSYYEFTSYSFNLLDVFSFLNTDFYTSLKILISIPEIEALISNLLDFYYTNESFACTVSRVILRNVLLPITFQNQLNWICQDFKEYDPISKSKKKIADAITYWQEYHRDDDDKKTLSL